MQQSKEKAMKQLIIKVGNKMLEVAPPDKEFKSNWYNASDEIKKRLGEEWRLPTLEELNNMYVQLHRNGVGGFADGSYYWSSAEFVNGNAWVQGFLDGGQGYDGKASTGYVRAVRAVQLFNNSTNLIGQKCEDVDICLLSRDCRTGSTLLDAAIMEKLYDSEGLQLICFSRKLRDLSEELQSVINFIDSGPYKNVELDSKIVFKHSSK